MISKGTGSGDPSPALIQDYTNKCKNATVPHAITTRNSAQSAYICDQDPAGDVKERLEKSSLPDTQEQDKKQRQADGQCNGSMKMDQDRGWMSQAESHVKEFGLHPMGNG